MLVFFVLFFLFFSLPEIILNLVIFKHKLLSKSSGRHQPFSNAISTKLLVRHGRLEEECRGKEIRGRRGLVTRSRVICNRIQFLEERRPDLKYVRCDPLLQTPQNLLLCVCSQSRNFKDTTVTARTGNTLTRKHFRWSCPSGLYRIDDCSQFDR